MASKITTPKKPSKDFPLFPHRNGQWAKKIRGKLHYFGVVADPQGALARYLDGKDDLLAGRTPRPANGALTVRDLANRFLTAKQILLQSGELSGRSFADYHATCGRLIELFGANRLVLDLRSDDFERLRAGLASTWGPVTIGNEIQRTRTVFKYAYDAGLVDHPVRFGPTFRRPNKKTLRIARASKGPRMFEAADIRRILDAATVPMRAMVLLAINCGFGNNDVATLPLAALNLKTGWVSFPRPKTGVDRRCPLWPKTVAALQKGLETRPKPRDPAAEPMVFVTKYGTSWAKAKVDNPVSKELTKLLKELKLHRPGLGFYALRHTFETVGGETRDQVAVDHIMGHARDDMASVYRERISDERLRAVTDFVRAWLWPESQAVSGTESAGRQGPATRPR